MECASDTESDTDSEARHPTFHDVNPDPDVGVPSFEAVRSAVKTLCERDAPSLFENKSYYQESSNLLLHFLDRVPQYLSTDHVPEVIQIFSQLGTLLFLQRLLDFRKCARLAEQVPGSKTLVITWIDVVLAKLSILATPVAVGLAAYNLEKEAEWIQLRREDDTVRAATQLPDSWKAVVAVMGTIGFSPAARRLATSLCFTAYILVKQINSDKSWPREGPPPLEVLHSLYLSINQAACASVSPSVVQGSFVDKTQLAMFVSLFADAHSHTEPGDITYTSHLRPEGFGHILEIIQTILGQSSSQLCVLERPDPAQCILLRWGNVVPWSWSTWSDQRLANTECLRSLSATWFFLVHASIHGTRHQSLDQRIFGIDLQCTLLSDALSSSLMVVQLLKEILDDRNWSLIPRYITIRILCKLCWATIQYLEANVLEKGPQFEDLVPQIVNSLIVLFPFIEMHDGEDILVRFLIVEALALIPVKVISSSLKKILHNKQFLSNLDESMRCCITLLSDQGGEKQDQDIQNHFAKSLLNFSTLLLQSSIDDLGLRQTISSFVGYISQSMLGGVDRHSLNTAILGSFLTALSILRSKKPEIIKIRDEDIWSLTTQGLNQHLSVPAAFAYYLLTTSAHRRDSLLRHEAWNYLLGVMSKILDRQLPEEEEPLALLVSPTICLALRSIPNGITRKCLLASPWALTMQLSMQELLNETQNESYFKQLQERIQSEGLKLVNELFDANGSSADEADPVKMVRLVYHRDCYKSELIPVYEDDVTSEINDCPAQRSDCAAIMSVVRPRSHSSHSPDWQSVRGRFNDTGGNGDEDLGHYQFRRNSRRGDSLPSSLESTPGHCLSSSHSKGPNGPSSGPPPKFPITPAEFHIFPSARSTGDTRRSQNAEIEKECLGVSHLTTLRSAAFWELRRSVIENGEALIRRMRDYELSRLHQQVRQKANERKRRGHKSSTLRPRCKARPNASDNDDVLMRSEDTSKGSSSWSPLSTSLDLMDVDGDHLGRKGPRSIPGDSQVQLPYDEGMLFTCNSRRAEEDSDSPLTYPESASPTPSSSSISLPFSQSLSMTTDRLLVSTTSSEKALAELNFAFANGACSITDYSPIWTYQKEFNTDEHDNIRQGDLWR